jgi:hypothetical protein
MPIPSVTKSTLYAILFALPIFVSAQEEIWLRCETLRTQTSKVPKEETTKQAETFVFSFVGGKRLLRYDETKKTLDEFLCPTCYTVTPDSIRWKAPDNFVWNSDGMIDRRTMEFKAAAHQSTSGTWRSWIGTCQITTKPLVAAPRF